MNVNNDDRAGRRSALCASILLPLYGLVTGRGVRALLRNLVLKLEKGPMLSLTIREIFRRYHDVEVGLYTLGPCEAEPERIAPGTVIGRYSSIYWTSRVLAIDRPTSRQFDHELVCDSALGQPVVGPNAQRKLQIGHDVFIGHNAIVLPTVEQIGDGSFIGAGSVVHINVPPYAVVTGNPARVVRYRFSPEKIKELLDSKWWLKNMDELKSRIVEFQRPADGSDVVR